MRMINIEQRARVSDLVSSVSLLDFMCTLANARLTCERKLEGYINDYFKWIITE